MKKWVYIAGPYTKGDVVMNVQAIILVAEKVIEAGFHPIVLHLNHLWHLISPHEYRFWMDYDEELLRKCDCLYRVAGESKGSDSEIVLAIELGLPVYYSLRELCIGEGL